MDRGRDRERIRDVATKLREIHKEMADLEIYKAEAEMLGVTPRDHSTIYMKESRFKDIFPEAEVIRFSEEFNQMMVSVTTPLGPVIVYTLIRVDNDHECAVVV